MIDKAMFTLGAKDFMEIAAHNDNEAYCVMNKDNRVMLFATYPDHIAEQAHDILMDAEQRISNLVNPES